MRVRWRPLIDNNNGTVALLSTQTSVSFRPPLNTQFSQRGEGALGGRAPSRANLADLRQVAIDIPPDGAQPQGGVAGALAGAGATMGGVVVAASGNKGDSKAGSKAGSGGKPGTALDAMAKVHFTSLTLILRN